MKIKKSIKWILSLVLIIGTAVMFSGCGHKHEMAEKVIKKATCTENGEIKHYCKTCDYSYNETVEAKHDYEESVLEKSTCIKKGTKKFTCKFCGNSYEKEIKLAEHHYENKYCTVCGEKKVGKIEVREPYGELSYGASTSDALTKCRISDVSAEITYGKMTVYITGEKTYDYSGENSMNRCVFLLVIKDKYGNIIYSDGVAKSCVVNQSFKIYVTPDGYFDDADDYYIELKDYT